MSIEPIRRFFSKYLGLVGMIALNEKTKLSFGSVLEKQVRKRPNNKLIIFEDRELTYKQFNELANQYAHLFVARGFKKGDTVALIMGNKPEYLIIHAGLAKIGVVSALINNNLRGKTLEHSINIADAKAIIVGYEQAEEYHKISKNLHLKEPGTVFVEKEGKTMETPQGMEDLAPLLANESMENPIVNPAITPADTLGYIYTSGTTGLPKATRIKQQKWLQLGYAIGGYGLNAIVEDTQYLCLPLYHTSGINTSWASIVMTGGSVALKRKFSASGFWDDIRKYNATLFVYIGELCRYLNNQPISPKDGDNPLKYLIGNGLRGEYWEEFQNRFNISRIIEVYGTTEGVGGLVNSKGVIGMVGRLTLFGILKMGEIAAFNPETEEFIRDSNGFAKKVNVGESGMFLAKINKMNPFPGYKNNEKATNSKIVENVFKQGDKYFNSGDLMRLHKKSYASFVDRLGDTFKWKGEVVATNEISDIINKFGQIEDANVYGVLVNNTEGRAGMVALALLPGESINWKKFAAYIAEKIPVYARPYFVRIRKQSDVTTSFKQIKTRLKKEGFDPAIISDDLYFLDPVKKEYVSLSPKLFENIQNGEIRF